MGLEVAPKTVIKFFLSEGYHSFAQILHTFVKLCDF